MLAYENRKKKKADRSNCEMDHFKSVSQCILGSRLSRVFTELFLPSSGVTTGSLQEVKETKIMIVVIRIRFSVAFS